MSKFPRPSAAIPADMPRDVRLQIVSTCPEIPDGDGWLHEIKHDGHRLVAIVTPIPERTATSGPSGRS